MKVGPFFFFLPFWPRTLHIASNGGLTSASHRLPPRQPRLACPNRARPRLQQHVLPSAALVPTYLSFFPVLFGTSRRQPPLPFPNMSRPSTTEERTTGECPPSRSVLRRTTTAGSAVMSVISQCSPCVSWLTFCPPPNPNKSSKSMPLPPQSKFSGAQDRPFDALLEHFLPRLVPLWRPGSRTTALDVPPTSS